MFCTCCGTKLLENARFCQACGARVINYEAAPIELTSAPKESKTVEKYSDGFDRFAKYGGIAAGLLNVDLMCEQEFISWCSQMVQRHGLCNVEIVAEGSKNGINFTAESSGRKLAFLCNHSRTTLGNSSIQKVFTAKYVHHCDIAVVITNQYFNQSAKELAEATATLLWDRNTIQQWLESPYAPAMNCYTTNCAPKSDIVERSEKNIIANAVDIILESGQASVSILQRKLRLGYAKCAQILDELEELGIVGPFIGSKPREILTSPSDWKLLRVVLLEDTLPF